MNYLIPIAAALVGAIIGAIFVWLIMRNRTSEAVIEANAAGEADTAVLLERLQGREQSLGETRVLLQRREAELAHVRGRASEIAQKHAQCFQAYQNGKQMLQEKAAALAEAKKLLAQKDSEIGTHRT